MSCLAHSIRTEFWIQNLVMIFLKPFWSWLFARLKGPGNIKLIRWADFCPYNHSGPNSNHYCHKCLPCPKPDDGCLQSTGYWQERALGLPSRLHLCSTQTWCLPNLCKSSKLHLLMRSEQLYSEPALYRRSMESYCGLVVGRNELLSTFKGLLQSRPICLWAQLWNLCWRNR